MSRRLLAMVIGLMVAGGALATFVVFGLGVGDETVERIVDEVVPDGDDDAVSAAPPTTTARVYVEPSPRPELPTPAEGAVVFSCDFTVACELDQMVQYRDAFIVGYEEGTADHGIAPDATFDDPICTAPEETRPWNRAQPYALTYRCIPMGNLDAAHQMSVAPDTTGYSFTASSPNLVFDDVERVSFTVNMTSAGERNFWEVAVIPADETWVDGMPCIPDLPCNDFYDYDDIGAVGVGNQAHEGSGFQIGWPEVPDGVTFGDADSVILDDGSTRLAPCPGDIFCHPAVVHEGQVDVRSRWAVVVEARDDGLWFGQEESDGVMEWAVADGVVLPDGPVRVLLKFHGYTPTKSGRGPGFDDNLSASEGAFTWHWDDFEVIAGSAVPSADYYGDLNPERFTTAGTPECVAFAQGQRDERNRTVAPLISCPEGAVVDDEAGASFGVVDALLVDD